MKQLILIFVAIFILISSKAQVGWTQPAGSSHIYNPNTTGNVGIGLATTTTPLQKLHVGGNIQEDGKWFVMQGGALYSDSSNMALFTDGNYMFSNRNNTVSRAMITSAGILGLYKGSSFSVSINPNGSTYFNGGNVGIGTTNPNNKLQIAADGVDDGSKYGAVQIIRATNPTDSAFHISFIRAGNMVAGIGYVKGSSTLGIWSGGTSIANTTITPAISITSEANVGIGTTDTKGYMFAVAGSAIATKVVVKQQASWPDYVFEPTYNLPSLQSVENFINVNKHLPEVPSAEVINKDGVDLGNNQAVLLKKIEELTLYLIEQNKKNEEQGELIKQQQQQLQQLRSEIKTIKEQYK